VVGWLNPMVVAPRWLFGRVPAGPEPFLRPAPGHRVPLPLSERGSGTRSCSLAAAWPPGSKVNVAVT